MVSEEARGMAIATTENPHLMPILADALDECGMGDLATLARSEDGLPKDILKSTSRSPEEVAAQEEADRVSRFRRSVFSTCGVVGNRFSIAQLEKKITRVRPRGSGSKRELAARLADACDRLALRRWNLACKGQRKATEKQSAELFERIDTAIRQVQGRCKERLIDAAAVIRTAREADLDGDSSRDGGRVTAAAYGYRWETTTVTAGRTQSGSIQVRISRGGSSESIIAKAKVWLTATR